jgi:hypothetical protein
MIKSKAVIWVRHVAHMEEMKYILGRKTEGERPLGRYECIWEDNIKMDLKQDLRVRNGFN